MEPRSDLLADQGQTLGREQGSTFLEIQGRTLETGKIHEPLAEDLRSDLPAGGHGLFKDPRSDLEEAGQDSTLGAEADLRSDLFKDPRSDLGEEKATPVLRKAVRTILLGLVFLVPLFFLPFTAPGDVLVFNKQVLIFGLSLAGLVA